MSKTIEDRVFYDGPLTFHAYTLGGSLYISGYATTPAGGTVTSVTTCLRNTSTSARTFTVEVSVRQGGSTIQAIVHTGTHAANIVSCSELSAFDADLEPGEYEIRVRYTRSSQENSWLGLPVTVSGTVFDVGIQGQRPPYMGMQLVHGVGIEYTIDENAATPPVISLAAENALIVPGFEVDLSDPSGPTTFFSIRNTTGAVLTVDAEYYGAEVTATPLRTDTHALAAQETLPIDVRSDVTDLETDGNIASGLVLITERTTSSADALAGDYYRVDFSNDFAAGERLIKPDDFCVSQELRFVDFGSGALITVIVDSPQGPTDPSFSYQIREEDGDLVAAGDFMTSDHLNVFKITDLAPSASFGTIIFNFAAANGGWASGRFSAFGRFSIELKADCRD